MTQANKKPLIYAEGSVWGFDTSTQPLQAGIPCRMPRICHRIPQLWQRKSMRQKLEHSNASKCHPSTNNTACAAMVTPGAKLLLEDVGTAAIQGTVKIRKCSLHVTQRAVPEGG